MQAHLEDPGAGKTASYWILLRRWITANTFAPPWLHGRWQRPGSSYVIAVLIELIAVALIAVLIHLLPTYRFLEAPLLLAIVFTALGWGAAPGIVATLVAVTLLDMLILPPRFELFVSTAEDASGLVLLLLLGVAASVVAGQSERRRRRSEALAQLLAQERLRLAQAGQAATAQASELQAIFEAMTDGVAVFDTDARLVRANVAFRSVFDLDADLTMDSRQIHERVVKSVSHDGGAEPGGEKPSAEQLPVRRMLRGDLLTSANAADLLIRYPDGTERQFSVTGAPVRDHEGHITSAVLVYRDVTEHWRLEQELAARARQIEAIFDAIPDGLGFFDARGTVMRFNSAAQSLFGSERREALDDIADAYAVRTLAGEPFPPEDLPLAHALRGEPSEPKEMLVRMADGTDQAISVRAAPWYDPRGTIEGVVVVSHDISALRQAEQEAAARASELEAIFDAMTDGVYVNDADGRLLRMNAAGRALAAVETQPGSGLPAAAASTLTSLAKPRDEQEQRLVPEQWPLNRVLAGEVLTNARAVDMIVRTLDGLDKQVNISGAPVRDAGGHVIRAVTVARDVTDRRQLERRTREALDALLAMAHTLIMTPEEMQREAAQGRAVASLVGQRLVDLTRHVLGCQRVGIVTFDPLTGRQQPVAVAGLTPAQEREWRTSTERTNMNAPEVDPDPELVARFFAGEAVIADMTKPPFNNQPNPFEVRTFLAVPLRVNGAIAGVLSLDHGGVPHEYTPDEVALAEAVAQLAGLMLERERLRQDREEARANALALHETNQRMDEFLSIASHELKSPLTGIRVSVQLARRRLRRVLSPADMVTMEQENMLALTQIDTLLDSTEAQIDRQTRLINDLLDVSRIQADHLELNLELLDVAGLVRESVNEQRLAWPARTLVLEALPDGVMVRADVDRMRQVLTNYISNALKYSPSDRPVAVELRLEEGRVAVRVRDQGPGLTAEQQQHLWNRYRRVPGMAVQDHTQAVGGGLGLGLYISRTIVERHGGQVGVESSPGDGSTFWFTLPYTPRA